MKNNARNTKDGTSITHGSSSTNNSIWSEEVSIRTCFRAAESDAWADLLLQGEIMIQINAEEKKPLWAFKLISTMQRCTAPAAAAAQTLCRDTDGEVCHEGKSSHPATIKEFIKSSVITSCPVNCLLSQPTTGIPLLAVCKPIYLLMSIKLN